MSINDPETKQMISRSLGTHAAETVQESTSQQLGKLGGSRTQSHQTRAQKLLNEDEVNRIGEDTILLLAKDARPIKAKKVKYYQDWTLKNLAALSADGLSLNDAEDGNEPREGDAEVPRPLLKQAQGFLVNVGIARASLVAQAA
jgi:type IV secretory pathway TraG/TraD family ATPase VirD4